jgi:hypothetical protein
LGYEEKGRKGKERKDCIFFEIKKIKKNNDE